MRCVLALALLVPGLALAQAYPSKPVRIIVPYPAGGIVDLMARAVGDGLGPKLGQPVIVEPRPGADASIGTDAVAKADPDGHTVLMATLALAVNPNLSKVPWHPVNDFEGVAHIGVVANVAAVTPALGVKDLKSFIELARSRPGQINYVNPGNGSSPHVSAELLQLMNGIKLTSINYKGIPPAIPDFLAGTVPFGFFPFGTIAGQIRSGKAQAIGIASPLRHKQFPDLPTMAEQGFASSQVNSWYAIAAPKKTPRAVIERLNRDLNALLAEDETIARIDKIGGTVIAGWSAQQTTKMIADDYARWADVIRKAGIAAN
ncbi:MAG TPA: tripartite tricarboxylate transporter substrate binding protein [Burkholderiales bacterium]|nr:tripartite tricarboxylate transporter substrate binding protein [Burkholderiales bacterium]